MILPLRVRQERKFQPAQFHSAQSDDPVTQNEFSENFAHPRIPFAENYVILVADGSTRVTDYVTDED